MAVKSVGSLIGVESLPFLSGLFEIPVKINLTKRFWLRFEGHPAAAAQHM